MIDIYAVESVIHRMTSLFNTTSVYLSLENAAEWLPINQNWREFYSTENRQKVAELALKDLNHIYRKKKVSPESFDGYQPELNKFKEALLEEVKKYRYNSFNKRNFLNYKRLTESVTFLEDRHLANCLTDTTYIETEKVTKDDMRLIIETFCYCFSYIADNLNKRVINVEQLTLLELPTEIEKLKELVETTMLGELFSWYKTEQGFYYWAKLYLDKTSLFTERVYEYLNELHPEFKLPEKKKEIFNYGVSAKAIKKPTLERFNTVPF